MGFVEGVSTELENILEYLIRYFALHPVRRATFEKRLAHGFDHVRFLLADRFGESERGLQLDPAEPIDNSRNLFLIDHDAVCFF